MYRNGEGLQQDYTEAIKWLRKAADQGDVWAQSEIGEMFAKGEGVTQNTITAYMWFEIASINSLSWDKVAALERDHFARDMTRADIETAKKRAKLCLESNYKQCDWSLIPELQRNLPFENHTRFKQNHRIPNGNLALIQYFEVCPLVSMTCRFRYNYRIGGVLSFKAGYFGVTSHVWTSEE